jgi:hypothetical protein
METLEYAKESVRIFHVESYSIVCDGADDIISIILASDCDFSLLISSAL